MNLVLLEPGELSGDGAVRLTDARAVHVRTVLRAVTGQAVRLGLVDGPFGVGTVTAVTADSVELRCVLEREPPPRPPVDVLLAVPRPKVLRRLWAQLAALGVGRIVLTNAGKVERNYFDTHLLEPAGFRPLLVEGLQQARDTRLPLVSVHRRFRALVEDELDGLCPDTLRLVAHPEATSRIGAADRDDRRVLLAVGPEGGWNAFELRLLESRGFTAVGMGPRVLRSDTACVALLALVHDAVRGRGIMR